MDLALTQIHEYKVFKDIGKAQFHNGKVVTMVSRRSESTLYMQSNMMADSKRDLLQMDISPKNLLNPSIPEWFP